MWETGEGEGDFFAGVLELIRNRGFLKTLVSCQSEKRMKAEYDFSKGERGKFYHPKAVSSFPIYLEPDVNDFISRLAKEKRVDVQELVNEWLRANIKVIETLTIKKFD